MTCILRRRLHLGIVLFLSLGLSATVGCHSAFIEVTVQNHSGAKVQLLEVDYPSASFGTESLADGGVFHYRFKVLGDGPTKLSWTDAAGKDHASDGPALHEGQEGSLSIRLDRANATWTPHLQP